MMISSDMVDKEVTIDRTITMKRSDYNPQEIEPKWQEFWVKNNTFQTKDNANKNMYILDMYPYPSGAGLHVGHPKGYIATDVLSRMRRMQGYNVLHPMGWDAFGLPAEQFAIKNKMNPAQAVAENVARYKEQLQMIGMDYDWSREINTTDPDYYKWTQWAFIQMYKKGLAFQSYEPINWCPTCLTGLANEDLESDGTCERCGSQVEKKPMRQWVLKITDYADRLLDDLETLDKWPNSVKISQKNWIGRSHGSEIPFTISNEDGSQTEVAHVFTTRADTLYGVTYVVIAPESNLIQKFESSIQNISEVKEYIAKAADKSEIDRTDMTKEKTGVQLEGLVAIHPITGEKVSVWAADYVLADYGTGVVMAVPAHDERDYDFAKKYDLEMKIVVIEKITQRTDNQIIDYKDEELKTLLNDEENNYKAIEQAKRWVDKHGAIAWPGLLVNSEEFNGMSSEEAKEKITLKAGGVMKKNFKLRDWVFSRQRYWGEPIPVVHARDNEQEVYVLADSELPLELPEVESYEPTGTGESPLADISKWVNVKGFINKDNEFVSVDGEGNMKNGKPAPKGVEIREFRRETNTMPQWAGSCWYYLRYIDPNNSEELVDKGKEKNFSPVNVYVGGMEHATRHLIYARFWHKFLFDIGVVSKEEPFDELHAPGLILAEDGRKMSKRWGNVVNPDDMVSRFGADAFRLYEMFMGPFENAIAWSTDGVVGTRRFLEKVWRISQNSISDQTPKEVEVILHQTIKKISEDIPSFRFNTGVSQLMICANTIEGSGGISSKDFMLFVQLLAPYAPHISEELWKFCGGDGSVHQSTWPTYDKDLATDDVATIGVQINGKVRAEVTINLDTAEAEVRDMVLAIPEVQKWIASEDAIKKFIYIPGRVISIVI